MINRVKEILNAKGLFRDDYFDTDKYVIDSFSLSYDKTFYIYNSALGTTRLQGLNTNELDNIVAELKNCNLKNVLTISISPKIFKGDYIGILTDISLEKIIGIYKKTLD